MLADGRIELLLPTFTALPTCSSRHPDRYLAPIQGSTTILRPDKFAETSVLTSSPSALLGINSKSLEHHVTILSFSLVWAVDLPADLTPIYLTFSALGYSLSKELILIEKSKKDRLSKIVVAS